jgi:hypothetical protein
VEQPIGRLVHLVAVSGLPDQPQRERVRPPPPGLAVTARVGQALWQSACSTPSQQSQYDGTAGMIVAENLTEEEGQGDQRAEDSVASLANLLYNDLCDPRARGNLTERQIGVKDQRAEQ